MQGNITASVAYLMKDKSRGTFYMIKLSGQTSLAVRRIPLFIRTIQPDQSTLRWYAWQWRVFMEKFEANIFKMTVLSPSCNFWQALLDRQDSIAPKHPSIM